MKPPFLTLASGRQIYLREASCLRCRRLICWSRWRGQELLWDSLSLLDLGTVELHAHRCPTQEADRDAS